MAAGDAARLHEVERLLDSDRRARVALRLGRLGDEVEAPPMDSVQIRVSALRKRPDKVQRGHGLEVRAQHPLRIRRPGARVELDSVHDVAAVRGELDVPAGLDGRRARLRELARQASGVHGGIAWQSVRLVIAR